MVTKHLVRSLASLFLIASISTAVRAEVEIVSRDGLLSISADNVSANDLAEELSNALDITVVMVNGEDQTLTLDIVDEPMEKALGRLSPNNMLVKDSDNNNITEVILMFGEGADGGSSSEQFLPSGSPAEEVVSEQSGQRQPEPVDPSALREPSRAERVRAAAAAASSDANLPAVQVPPMFAEEGQPVPIDPQTGLPLEQQQ